jgi:hypothetical protein
VLGGVARFLEEQAADLTRGAGVWTFSVEPWGPLEREQIMINGVASRLAPVVVWGLVVGVNSGILAYEDGASLPHAVLSAWGGFVTSVLLAMAVAGYLASRPDDRETHR